MTSRRSELDAKKQRLQELRKQRERRLAQSDESTTIATAHTSQSIQTLVQSLVGPKSHIYNSTKSHQQDPRNLKSISIQTEQDPPPNKVEVVTYNKGIQTEETLFEQNEQVIGTKPLRSIFTSIGDISENTEVEEVSERLIVIDEAQLAKFLTRSFKIINRAIHDDNDILRDYQNDQVEFSKKYSEGDKPRLYQKTDEVFPSTRHGIFAIDFSQFTKDLVVFSCGKSIYIYNMHFRKMENQINSTSPVMNVKFSLSDPNLVIGTCFNGKIKIWSLTEGNLHNGYAIPYLETTISSQLHSYSLSTIVQFVENNREFFITSSSDGKICHWDSQILNKTLSDPFILKSSKEESFLSLYDEITPTSLIRLGSNQRNDLLVGAEDGKVYQLSSRSSMIKATDKSTNIDHIWHCHEAPITALSTPIGTELYNILATASMDWKCRCFNLSTNEPILDIYRNFSILDVQFRPKNPLHLGLIYNETFEIVNISNNSVVLSISGNGTILSRFRFQNENRVVLGDINGKVSFWELFLTENDPADITEFKGKYSL